MPPMPYNLRELGINSEYRAAELEHELGLTFSDFTPEQLDTWQRQTVCLNQYALTRTYSSAARTAGVTVYTMEAWERDNELEFVRRKEMADREFCDGLEELLLERARTPDSPPSLLTAVLRAQMPEKYRGSRYERDPDDDHGYSPSGPDTYHNLIADIVRQMQQNEDPVDDDENRDLTPPEHTSIEAGFTPAPDPPAKHPQGQASNLPPVPPAKTHQRGTTRVTPNLAPGSRPTSTGANAANSNAGQNETAKTPTAHAPPISPLHNPSTLSGKVECRFSGRQLLPTQYFLPSILLSVSCALRSAPHPHPTDPVPAGNLNTPTLTSTYDTPLPMLSTHSFRVTGKR